MEPTFIILAAAAAVAVWLVAVYNGLIRLRNRTEEAWSDIDVQLKRRHDLIPNLVASVKGFMQHERELLENITRARSAAMTAESAGNRAALGEAEKTLGGLLGNLRVAFEAYPDLKANQNMAQLMDELSDTENKIQASRRFYNSQARDFNIKIEVFPNNLFAQAMHFVKFDFFQVDNDAERQNVSVKF
jgi:LemA protein